MVWFQLSHDKFQWRTLVNTVMNLRVSINGVYFPDKLSQHQLLKGTCVRYS
jgi:hypothetical protein